MTPCEEKGYKVGDRFEIYKNDDENGIGDYRVGDTVELLKDDGSDIPKFGRIGSDYSYVWIENIRPFDEKEKAPEPDWSKAPEGATHAVVTSDGVFIEWYRHDTGQAYYAEDQIWSIFHDLGRAKIPRPYTGEGLPEVGEVCEYVNSLGIWSRVEITAIARNGICFIDVDTLGESYVHKDARLFRPIPRNITIGDMEVPEPVREPLDYDDEYWAVDHSIEALVDCYTWANDKKDRHWLKRGLIHRTKEAAITHAKALIKASGGEVE